MALHGSLPIIHELTITSPTVKLASLKVAVRPSVIDTYRFAEVEINQVVSRYYRVLYLDVTHDSHNAIHSLEVVQS